MSKQPIKILRTFDTLDYCFGVDSDNNCVFIHKNNFIDTKDFDSINNGSLVRGTIVKTSKGFTLFEVEIN
jgi:hypothetical protein